jgi:hypothetical protein
MGNRRRIRVGKQVALATVLTTTLAVAGSALGAFPEDPPSDPSYNPAEQGGPGACATKSSIKQQYYLYSFIPQCTPGAADAEGASGGSVDSAWRDFTTGDDSTLIAYIEGGINWRNDPEELANKVFINPGELPAPTTKVADGVFNAEDFADTDDANGNGLVDPEDIIVRFSDGKDDDSNGYVDDISGWDFYNDQNNPATVDSAYEHANFQLKQAGSETDNGFGEAGICPDCMLLPIKGGAEALDLTDDLAEAWMYAADMDSDVLVSVTADLGYSSFMRDAVEYVWDRGTVMVEASNDFNSLDHQGGMFWPHVLPGNAVVANSVGLQTAPSSEAAQNAATTTYRARSAFTSWGAKNMFSAATGGGTTSEATPTVGGLIALVLSYGKEAAKEGLIDGPLSPSEVIQVVRATSSDVASNPNPPLGWPAKPGFDLQYGYGRPNVHEAMESIAADEIPPEAWIDSPRWYSLYDPTRTERVPVTGHVAAPRSGSYAWTLEFAPGPEPEDGEFIQAGSGAGTGAFDGKLGTIDLGAVPESFWSAAFGLSETKTLETNDQYAVTIRLRVTDENGLVGEERRAIAVHHDPTLREGFPRRIGVGGEAQPALADLKGKGKLAIVFGDADGRVHALDHRGRSLPGFPVLTKPTKVQKDHPGVDPGHEPIVSNVAIGDLKGRGRQSIVAATTTGRVYAWSAKGKLLKGWPRALRKGVEKPDQPRPDLPFTRPAIMGSSSPPVLANLDADRALEVVQAGWDGHLHAWNANGKALAGWPVKVTLPDGTVPPAGMVAIQDQKLDLSPTLAELDGDSGVELVQRTQYSFAKGAGLQVPNGGVSNVVAYNNDGSRVPDFLISGTALAFYYGSAQEFITEGVNNPSSADLDNDGLSEITSAAGIFSPTTIYNSDGSERQVLGPVPGSVISLVQNPTVAGLLSVLNGNLPDDVPVNFTTSGAFGEFGAGGGLSYAEPGSGAATVAGSLLLAGSGLPINSYMRAFDAQTGSPVPGMPAKSQGLDFLGAPLIADVTGDGEAEIVEGGDSSAMHAFSSTGAQAEGFPKFHTGWVLWGPATGDLDSDGDLELVATTREGYLMVWDTPGRADANDQWWGYRHDERNTGTYDIDTRPPGAVRKAKLRRGGRKLVFKAPGDDWYAGQPEGYRVRCFRGGQKASKKLDATVPAGQKEALEIGRCRVITVQGYDDAGNRGRLRKVKQPRARRPRD